MTDWLGYPYPRGMSVVEFNYRIERARKANPGKIIRVLSNGVTVGGFVPNEPIDYEAIKG